MEWYYLLLLMFGSLIVLMAAGMTVAFTFLIISILMMSFFWVGGAHVGLGHLVVVLRSSVASFILMPIAMFVLMGEILFHSGIARDLINSLDQWIGRVPGRLSLLGVAGGTVFATLTGVSMSSCALLGTILLPEMDKHGYDKSMSIGSIVASGALAVIIPPSTLAVLYGAIAQVNIGAILLGIIIPGLLMAAIYAIYIVAVSYFQPSLAPSSKAPRVALVQKLKSTCWHLLPVGLIIFLVIGVIFLGIATPTEAAALGAIGSFILVGIHGKLNWQLIKKVSMSTLELTCMLLMLIATSTIFSQILAFTGASAGLAKFATDLPVSPTLVVIAIVMVLLILGCFMSVIAIMLITIPLVVPVVTSLGFNPVWFGVVYIICMEMGAITPPFGLNLFVIKNIASQDTTMADVFRSSLPWIGLQLMLVILLFIFPKLTTWLPRMVE
jgi:tripartite ATP-independent transporter DctM subunit